MQIFIPTIGTKMVLNKPWTFTLYDESRNYNFWVGATGKPPIRKSGDTHKYIYYSEEAQPIQITIPAGHTLSVDRVYIRKGVGSYDSVSFRLLKGGSMKAGRFWVKLPEVNSGLDVTVIP